MPLINPITESQIPPPIARDKEVQAAGDAHVKTFDPHNQYLRKSPAHNHNTVSPDAYPTGWASQDLTINGVVAGWHILTLLRADNPDFGIQLAIADTLNAIYYRIKIFGNWQSWLKVNLTTS